MEKRQSNIELLRIILMLMIISHHILVHGFGLEHLTAQEYKIDSNTYVELVFNSFLVIGVNCFVFISGFFGIKFNLKKVISIVVKAVTYSVSLYLVFCMLSKVEFSIGAFIKSFFPISTNLWWFVTTYVGLYFLSPFLNAGVEKLDYRGLWIVLVGYFVLNCMSSFMFGGISKDGYHIFHFIFLYLLGRFMRVNKITVKNPLLVVLFCTFIIGLLVSVSMFLHRTSLAWHLFYYNNPLIVLSAIALFFLFIDLKINNNGFVNGLAQCVFGVYMIHDYPLVRVFLTNLVDSLQQEFMGHETVLLLIFIVLVLSVFLTSSLIEYIRAITSKNIVLLARRLLANSLDSNRLFNFILCNINKS